MERLNISRQPTGGLIVVPAAADGVLQCWERPRVHCRYLLSVRGGGVPKVVGGRTDRERSVLMVLRKWFEQEQDGKIVPTRLVCRLMPPAVLDPTPLAELVAMVADWYGDALTFVEIKDGALLAKECQRLGVGVQSREVLDKSTSQWSKDIGWLTDAETGPAALNALVNAVRLTGQRTTDNGLLAGAIQIECPHALDEMETFDWNGEAAAISFDDDVRALATGLYNIEAASMLHPETRPRMGPRDGWKVAEAFGQGW